ncbi:MAG TPA: 30S ribosome-binding factor RbfA [Chthoniobacterales bacterium]|jgi:ribosome-binding factor A|nr:30S ribosome-binding factor RbfA [Chthoniobacterales bacterium]
MATPLLHYSTDSPVKHRQLRVNALLKRELSNSIAREVTFESALVSINHVNVTPDLKNAHVFVSVLGSADGASVINKLEAHRPALQAELSRRVVLKYTPHLVFHLDDSIQRGARVIEILQEIETPPTEHE